MSNLILSLLLRCVRSVFVTFFDHLLQRGYPLRKKIIYHPFFFTSSYNYSVIKNQGSLYRKKPLDISDLFIGEISFRYNFRRDPYDKLNPIFFLNLFIPNILTWVNQLGTDFSRLNSSKRHTPLFWSVLKVVICYIFYDLNLF